MADTQNTLGGQPGKVSPAPALAGTRTEANLKAAFAGESQANRKYTFYAGKARRDGYEEIAALFEETAKNEEAHAQIWFDLLHDGQLPFTDENLNEAGDGEHYEWAEMYPAFAAEAKAEGFTRIAALFELVGQIEDRHEKRFRALAEKVEGGQVFTADGDAIWICRNCGHTHIGKSAPTTCPVCGKPQAWFEQKKS